MGCTVSKQARRESQQSPSPYLRSYSLPANHIVSLTSSTLGSLRLDPSDSEEEMLNASDDRLTLSDTKAWSDMMDRRLTKTPPYETINTWELMAGLEDPTPLPAAPTLLVRRSFSFNNTREIPKFTGIVKARIAAFQATIDARKANSDQKRAKPALSHCPPDGDKKVVLYFTSLRGIRETYEDCWAVRVILHGYGVRVDERDVSLHAGFREELRELLGGRCGLPRVFAGGRYLGGAVEMKMMHERGELGKVMEGCEVVKLGKDGEAEQCGGCGGVRFVPCKTCSGSCKVYVEEEEEGGGGFRRCPDCNENGLVRCPLCC